MTFFGGVADESVAILAVIFRLNGLVSCVAVGVIPNIYRSYLRICNGITVAICKNEFVICLVFIGWLKFYVAVTKHAIIKLDFIINCADRDTFNRRFADVGNRAGKTRDCCEFVCSKRGVFNLVCSRRAFDCSKFPTFGYVVTINCGAVRGIPIICAL